MVPPSLPFNLASILLLVGAASGASIGGNAASNALRTTVSWPKGSAAWTWAAAFACMTMAIGVAAIRHDPAMPAAAAGVCFSASVAAMTLGLGVVLIVANRGAAKPYIATETSNIAGIVPGRSASLLLPVALLVQLIGFAGIVQSKHAAMLFVEAVAIAPLCIRASRPHDLRWIAIVRSVLALGLIVISGWAAVIAVADLSARSELFRPAVANSLVLGPVIVLPMIPILATLAENGLATIAIDALVLFSIMNLCLVLPTLALLQPGMVIPLLSWRLDSLLLVVVGLLLLPPAIGRWSLGKREGAGLLVCFVVYLMVTLIVTFG